MEWSKLAELFTIQFPVAALNLAAVYLAFRFIDRRDKRLDERADQTRREIREDADREIARLQEAQKAHAESKQQEVERLTGELSSKIDKLTKKVDDLRKELGNPHVAVTDRRIDRFGSVHRLAGPCSVPLRPPHYPHRGGTRS